MGMIAINNNPNCAKDKRYKDYNGSKNEMSFQIDVS